MNNVDKRVLFKSVLDHLNMNEGMAKEDVAAAFHEIEQWATGMEVDGVFFRNGIDSSGLRISYVDIFTHDWWFSLSAFKDTLAYGTYRIADVCKTSKEKIHGVIHFYVYFKPTQDVRQIEYDAPGYGASSLVEYIERRVKIGK